MSDDQISLRDYFDEITRRRDREVDEVTRRRDREVELARAELHARLEGMNEFRRQIEQERGRYITVDRYEEKHTDLERRLAALENWKASNEGGASQSEKDVTRRQWSIGVLVVLSVAFANAVLLFLSSH